MSKTEVFSPTSGFGDRVNFFIEDILQIDKQAAAKCSGKSYSAFMAWSSKPNLTIKVDALHAFVSNCLADFCVEKGSCQYDPTCVTAYLCFGAGVSLNPFGVPELEGVLADVAVDQVFKAIAHIDAIINEFGIDKSVVTREKQEIAVKLHIKSSGTLDKSLIVDLLTL